MQGFFRSVQSTPPDPVVARCGSCGLSRGCSTPKMPVTGEGRRRVLVVAEAPGSEEDERGIQLIGKAGQKLRGILDEFDVDLDQDCWKTNAVCCRPRDNGTPTEGQVASCRPNVLKAIKDLRPDVIVPLGAAALRSVVGHVWRGELGPMGRWAGWRIPCREWNAWICPTYHPSYLLRTEDPVADIWVARHLEAAFKLEGTPWPDGLPCYEDEVSIVDPKDAAYNLDALVECGGEPAAFDFETNMLKPDGSDAKIACCAVSCEGQGTYTFPWIEPAVGAMGRFLRSKVLKIAANIKFEDRWTRKVFGHPVRNWSWDTMQAAHVLDNRRGITSLAFQAFVKLGQGVYGESVSPYLKADGSNVQNRVFEADLGELLLYNGLDARLTYDLAMIQRKEMEEVV